MDKLACYREIVRRVIEDYADPRPAHGNISTEIAIDPVRDHYEVLHVGWDGERRVHGSVVHIDIIGDKIWIQHDGTNRPVADELIAAGVPNDDIVLAFYPEDERQYTDFAVA